MLMVESVDSEKSRFVKEGELGKKKKLTFVGILRTHNSSVSIFNKMKSWNQMIKGLHRH